MSTVNIRTMLKKIDTEALVKLCEEAEVKIPQSVFSDLEDRSEGASLRKISTELARLILKAYFSEKEDVQLRTFSNDRGFSMSLTSPIFQEVKMFRERLRQPALNQFQIQREDYSLFLRTCKVGAYFTEWSNHHHVFCEEKHNRVIFRFDVKNYNLGDMLTQQLLEVIYIYEMWTIAHSKLEEWSSIYDSILEEVERAALEERERVERLERERIEREQEERRQELARLEAERLERERLEREERERRDAEYAARQRLIRAGATEEGINIAERLLASLNLTN